MNRPQQQISGGEQGGPIAGPVASNDRAISPLPEGQSRPLRSGNSGAQQGTTAAPKRHYGHRLSGTAVDLIKNHLSDRDHAILRSVDDHQFLSIRHIETLHFDSIAPDARSRVARRALARLRELRVLDTLDRRIGGVRAGSQGLIYHVGVVGDRLIERPARRRGRLRFEPSARFLNHRLAVADAHVTFTEADRDARVDLVDSAVEPVSWRTYTGLGATRRTLKPDLYAETATTNDLVRAWFIEVDLGTEHIPTLMTKCREYEAYRRSGIEQDRHGAFPTVVWSLTHPDSAKADRRRHALIDAIDADRTLPSVLFRVVSPEAVVPLIENGGVQ